MCCDDLETWPRFRIKCLSSQASGTEHTSCSNVCGWCEMARPVWANKKQFSVLWNKLSINWEIVHTQKICLARKRINIRHQTWNFLKTRDSPARRPALRCSSGAWALRLNERNIQYAFRLRRRFNEGNIERIEMSSGTIKSVEREHWTQSVVKWRAWLRFRGIIKQLNEAGEPVHLDHWLLDGSKLELCVFLMCK